MGKNPTDRGKLGVKKSLLVEAGGGPLAIVLGPANRNDHLLLAETLDAIVAERIPTSVLRQHLCLDKGYDNATGWQVTREHGYIPHIRRIGEEKQAPDGERRYPARRWVVERTIGWLSRCRGLLVRYEKDAANYLGLLKLACAMLWFRRLLHLAPDLR